MSGSRSQVAVTITATDRASAQIDQINRRLAAMTAPVDRVRKSMDRLAQNVGFRDVGRAARDMGNNFERMAGGVARAIPAFGQIGAAMSVAGVAAASRQFAAYGQQLQLLSRQAGMSVGQLQQVGNVTGMLTGNFEGGATAAANLAQQIYKMRTGQGDTNFIAALSTKAVGVDIGDVSSMPTAKAMDLLLHKIAKVKGAQAQLQLGTAIFGASFQTTLWPAVQGGTAVLDRYLAISRQVVHLTPNQVSNLASLNLSFNRVGQDVEGLAGTIIAKLAPAMGQGADSMAAWIEKNHQWLSSDIAGNVKHIASEFASVAQAVGGWKAVGGDVLQWYGAKFFPGIIGGAMRVDVALRALARWGGYKGITGQTDQQRQQDIHQQEGSFDAWVYKHLGFHTGQVDRLFGGNTRTADVTMDPTKRGFLDTLAGPESGGQYDVKNGGAHFKGFAQFPEGVAPGGTSTAAGRYQFTSPTWHSVAKTLGLKDFSPQSQDKGAWYLAATAYRARTGRDLERDLQAGNRQPQIADALKGIWPSLPGGSQSRESPAEFAAALNRNLALPAPTGPAVNIGGGTGRPPPVATPASVNLQGGAEIRVKVSAPAGTRTSAVTTGNVWSGPARIEQMPDAGATP